MYEHTARNPHGYSVITEPGGQVKEFDTLQCCPCGGHFQVVPGSGIQRGFCNHCHQVTCGKAECNVCLPLEKWLDQQEKGGLR